MLVLSSEGDPQLDYDQGGVRAGGQTPLLSEAEAKGGSWRHPFSPWFPQEQG